MTGHEFKERREALGLTQKELAAILEVDTRTVRRWEAAPWIESGRQVNPLAARILEALEPRA